MVPSRILLSLCLFIFLQGCVQFQQPSKYTIEKEFIVRLNKTDAASRIKKWLLQNNFIVVENTSTIITATSNNLDQLQGYAYDSWNGISYTNVVVDCGRIINANAIGYGSNGAQLSILLEDDRMDSGTGTRVIVNFVPTVNTAVARTCVSTGAVERTIKSLLSN